MRGNFKERVYQSLTADRKLEWQHAGFLLLAAAGSSWYETMHESRCGWQRVFFNDTEAAAPNSVFQLLYSL